jgi:hypothetical protein
MNDTEFRQTLDTLIDGWCERRALGPLAFLLRAYPGVLAHIDQKFKLLEALKDVKGLCRKDLTQEELHLLIEVHNELEDSLLRK